MTFKKVIPPMTKMDGFARVPVKIWTNDVEDEALAQLENLASMPFIFKHVAVMPDCHAGIGATIGSVVATKRAVIPSAVGVDIGCGMMAVKTSLSRDAVEEKAKEIFDSITRRIPLGMNSNSKLTETAGKWKGWGTIHDLSMPISLQHVGRVAHQMGSLGGGNHFIEICLDEHDEVWIMLHSGSRNIGKVIAEHHINKAKGFMKEMFISLPDPDLAYFAESQPEFKNYLRDVEWAQEYALENRREMMRRVKKALSYAVYGEDRSVGDVLEINCHHNYISREHHYGENCIVTRKGAIRARKDDWGIIPGSMGAKSYIVKGLENPEAFHSAPHGAGRRMSRTKARNSFNVADLEQQTLGVTCRKDAGVLDEIPGAYKPIDEVIDNSKSLVEVHATLRQIICVKG